MTGKQQGSKKTPKQKTSDESEVDDFAYEVSSTVSNLEVIEELSETPEKESESDEVYEETQTEVLPPKKTIKILSEKDMEIKETPPPNYSPYFVCALHFKDQKYKKRKLLKVKQID